MTIERVRLDAFPTRTVAGHAVRAGDPRLPGARTVAGGGVNFSVFAEQAETVSLVLFHGGDAATPVVLPFPDDFRTGRVFSMVVFGLDADSLEYGFLTDHRSGEPFERGAVLADPYATRMAWRPRWGTPAAEESGSVFRCGLAADDFDWGEDRRPAVPAEDLVVYELGVRSFTAADTANPYPGTFAGLVERLDHLVALGINCVELLPVFEFDELDVPRSDPITHEPLRNLWGYNTLGFFAPKAGLAWSGRVGLQADELKQTVKSLHAAGIEVVLDVVFNHTGEGDRRGVTASFRGLAEHVFYLLDENGNYLNFSGTGNTVNANNPIVRQFIVDCLRYWVAEFHIDGFRFDLASILDRGPDGAPMLNPPVIEALAFDPVLRDCKLIAEAWDAGGLYQVGTFPDFGRWMEWNGKYRDTVRRFLKGDPGQVGELATRFVGSPDLYRGRGPASSVNFVTCHDGATLADLVTYQERHNEANGEGNRDGSSDENGWNHGHEGPTDDADISALRARQIKNALVLLMTSSGVPMLLAGDEFGRTQQGNNNAYCQDNATSHVDWSLVSANADLLHFVQRLIAVRRQLPLLRPRRHPGDAGDGRDRAADVTWHGRRPGEPDWSDESRLMIVMVGDVCSGAVTVTESPILVAANAAWWDETVELPDPGAGRAWHQVLATSGPRGAQIVDDLQQARPIADHRSAVFAARSCHLLLSRPAPG